MPTPRPPGRSPIDSGTEFAPSAEALLASGVDGFVIAAATPAHAAAAAPGRRGAGSRPSARSRSPRPWTRPSAWPSSSSAQRRAGAHRLPAPVRRRLPAAARRRSSCGELGFVHTIRATTHDQSPPHAAYIPTSGGIFRDCIVHDFDIIRFVTGREVVSVYATGANKGEAFFGEAGDVDTAAAVLTLDDGTLVLRSAPPATTAAATTCAWRSSAARAPSPSASTTPSRCAPPRPGVDLPARPAALVLHGALPAGLPRRADRLLRRRRRRTAQPVHRRATPSRRSASPRPASCPAASGASCDLSEIPTVEALIRCPCRPALAERVAGAPISWGVCEVPGWGWQSTRTTVLAQMREVGIAATEFGPDGFLPEDPEEKADDPGRPRPGAGRPVRPRRPPRPRARPPARASRRR